MSTTAVADSGFASQERQAGTIATYRALQCTILLHRQQDKHSTFCCETWGTADVPNPSKIDMLLLGCGISSSALQTGSPHAEGSVSQANIAELWVLAI